jgi:hypothetical protein
VTILSMVSRELFCAIVVAVHRFVPCVGGAWDGQTDVTKRLNDYIKQSPLPYSAQKAYTGGKGVFMRNPYDGYEHGGPHSGKGGAYEVLPASFISNDIFASNKLFPRFDQNFFDWESCPMMYVVGSGMSTMLYDFEHVQDEGWGWGVFYPWDSNAADFRCEWLDIKGTPHIYDCPGYSKNTAVGSIVKDSLMFGAGYFDAGNPNANYKWGGGAGCHFSGLPYGCNDQKKCTNDIDQIHRGTKHFAEDDLVKDMTCECNYAFNGNWYDWVAKFGNMTSEAAKGTLPEAAMCWTNNIRDMINLGNYLFWARSTWFNTGEVGDHGPSGYWGWNEVPLARTGDGGITNPELWDAIVIKMPLYVCKGNGADDHLGCLSAKAKTNLENDITKWVKDGNLVPGVGNVGKRPGAYVVMMREWLDDHQNSFSYFFCTSWTSPTSSWEIVFEPITQQEPTGACYVVKGVGYKDSVLDQTFPDPIPKAKAKAIVRARAQGRMIPGMDVVV